MSSIAIGLGRYLSALRQSVKHTGGALTLLAKSRGPRFFSIFEREEVSRGVLTGLRARFIARGLDRAPSTISREIKRNGTSGDYHVLCGQKSAAMRARRPRSAKLATNPPLRTEVEAKLELRCSGQQICAWLAMAYPEDRQLRVSHGRIYISLFVQSRGALRKELHKSLRTGRALRRR